MFIVGHISSREEAAEFEYIVTSFVVAHRIKTLAHNLPRD